MSPHGNKSPEQPIHTICNITEEKRWEPEKNDIGTHIKGTSKRLETYGKNNNNKKQQTIFF